MKTHLSFLALLCMLLFTSAPNLFAQCTIPLLDIKDSVTIKALRKYVDVADATNLKREEKYIDKKTTIVLLEEAQIHQTDGRTLKLLEVNMAQMNYYKYWKMSIIGYFYIDKVLFLVTSPFIGLFTTKNYDYDNCLSQVLQNHSLREYDAPKRIKKILHNKEVEMRELGESIDLYQARITINLLDKNTKEPYIIQFYR